MSVAGYTTAVEARPRGALALWLEIEGLPYAYGTVSKDSSWFSGRAAASRFEGVRSWFAKDSLPSLPPQTLDHLEGAVGGGALSVQIVDVDGSLTELTASARTDGRCVFQTAVTTPPQGLTASTTGAQTVSGDTSTWPASGAAFIGYETITYSSKTTGGVTIASRGAYRSRATSHAGGVEDPGVASNGSSRIDVGDLLTPYPTKLEGRRVWLMAGHSPASDTDCTEVWSGVIEEVSFGGADLRTLSLSCSQSFGELNAPAFGDLGTFGVPAREGAASPSWIIASRTQTGQPGSFLAPEIYEFGAVPYQRIDVIDDATAAAKRRFLLADTGRGVDVLRLGGNFNTVGTSINVYRADSIDYVTPGPLVNNGGSSGSFIQECVYIHPSYPPFTAGDHPLQVLLQLLLSDFGNGVNHATYDTLPSQWGIGLKPDRIDIAGIEDMIASTPDLRVRTVIAKPIEKLGEWARTHLLKPFGFFLRPSLGNLLSVGRLQSPNPDEITAAVAISRDDVVALGGWSSDVLSVIGTVVWKFGKRYDPGEREIVPAPGIGWTETNHIQDNGRIVAIDYPKAGSVTIDASSLPYSTGRSPEGMNDYCGRVAARFAQPVATLDLTVTFKHIVREVGDFVSLTHDVIPSRLSATRGVSSQVWEVVGKTADFKRMTVGLTLRQTAITDLDTRYLAPAMLVVSVAGDDVTVSSGGYVDSTIKSTAAFAVGDKVRGYDPENLFNRTTVREIMALSPSPTVATLDDATGITADMVLIHADYADWDVSTSTAAASLAFRANVSATLNGDDPAEMA